MSYYTLYYIKYYDIFCKTVGSLPINTSKSRKSANRDIFSETKHIQLKYKIFLQTNKNKYKIYQSSRHLITKFNHATMYCSKL